MSGNFFNGQFFGGGFFGASSTAVDTHDGVDEEEARRKHKKHDKERDEDIALKRSERERFREALELAFDTSVLGTDEFKRLRKIARPYVERMESGAIAIKWDEITDKASAEMRAILDDEDDDEIAILL